MGDEKKKAGLPGPGTSVVRRGPRDSTRIAVGKKIRTLRRGREMKLLDVAVLTDIDVGSLSRIERGQQGWSPETLDAIATALGVDVPRLFDRHGATETDYSSVLVPQYRPGIVTLEDSGPLVPFPRAWLPKTVRTTGLVALSTMEGFACDFLVDTFARELAEGKLFAFDHQGGHRVRRVFWTFDRSAVRLAVVSPTAEAADELIPSSAVSALQVIGRVVWGGGPM